MTNTPNFSAARRRFIRGAASAAALSAGACTSAKTQPFDAEVIVLGAGLSGLYAARLLAAEGKDVLVLEGSGRIGGRLHTLGHGAAGRTEAGGEQIGASYARILNTLTELGLSTTPDIAVRRGTTYSYKGRLYDDKSWKVSPDTPFTLSFKGASPGAPLFGLAAKTNPLRAASDWREAEFTQFDISASQFLKDNEVSAEGRRVVEIALNGNSLDSYSMLNLYRSLQLYSQSRGMGVTVSIDGGAQRLPEAMATALPRAVKLGARALAIKMDATGVTVMTRMRKSYRAAYCICALPFPAAKRIDGLTQLLPTLQQDAVAGLPYTQIYQIHFRTEDRFWERDGLPADTWTDSPYERIFADRDASGEPNGMFRIWINGETARERGQTLIDHSSLALELQSQLSQIRPEFSGEIEVLGQANWTQSNPLAGGAYMHWAPGQAAKWAGAMGAASGRLQFAGEHLSYLHTGMEGAMEAGENAAFALI